MTGPAMDAGWLRKLAQSSRIEFAAELAALADAGFVSRVPTPVAMKEVFHIFRRRAAWNESAANEMRDNISGYSLLLANLQQVLEATPSAVVYVGKVETTQDLLVYFVDEAREHLLGILKWKVLPCGGPHPWT